MFGIEYVLSKVFDGSRLRTSSQQVDANGNVVTPQGVSSVLYDGTITLSDTNQHQITTTKLSVQSVLVQADPSNATGNDVYVGVVNSQSIRLTPGASETITINDPSLIYVKAVAQPARVNWHARG